MLNAALMGNRSGRPETRCTWTFADGAVICPSDEKRRANLFAKMMGALDAEDLLMLESIIARRRVDIVAKELAVLGIRPAGPNESEAAAAVHEPATGGPVDSADAAGGPADV